MLKKIFKNRECKIIFSVLTIVLLIIKISPVYGEEKWNGKKSDAHGYTRYTFKFAEKNAWVIVPKKAAPGKPWVWRGRWANFHPGTDIILLSKGYHIVYFDTGNMLGCDKALDLWDKFYDEMTSKYGLSKKPALESVSRGSLFVLRWAARNIDKVSCIYLDSPVCDLKSWPLGKWKGDRDRMGISQLAKYYGLKSDKEIMAFKGNPIDEPIVKPLAEAKIPILAIVNNEDRIVPPYENIEIFAKEYKKYGGGDIEILHPLKKDKATFKGHHFRVPNPQKSADFILKYSK